ncbi:MAG: tRNA preQ1(34) S-adenosylmethionine ribosyltransferase-isomerase QueA, partial [Pseudomonadota bacterium]
DAFAKLQERKHAFVTLHVGAGTFKPVDAENIYEHKMHFESFYISKEAKEIIKSNDKIIAFGTTACRAIESFVSGKTDTTNLFLHPENTPLRVNHLLTNFHLPKSTLLMLVSSFIGTDKALELYNLAIAKKYRFYSYGDAMLII